MSELSENNMLTNGVVDTDIKSNGNLLNNADTAQDVQNKVLTTEVTSIAREEQLSGQQIATPSPEELYTKASMSYIRNMKHLNDLIQGRNGPSYKISRKGMNRLLNSILQLPIDNVPVTLQGKEEKMAFALGQRVIADRYLMTHFHIVEERKRLQKEQEQASMSQETKQEQQTVAETKENNNEQV
jgi:hypothetical protein